MKPRFDVFRKQNDRFIKWIGTAEGPEDLEKLIRTDCTSASQEDYLVYRSAYGVTEAIRPVLSQRELRIAAPAMTL